MNVFSWIWETICFVFLALVVAAGLAAVISVLGVLGVIVHGVI